MMLAKLNILKPVVKINLAEDKCLLEPYVLNGTCTVLMRGQGSNSLSLSDLYWQTSRSMAWKKP